MVYIDMTNQQTSEKPLQSNTLSIPIVLLLLLGFLLASPAWSSTYQCEDSSGVTVLTDSPAQLTNCRLLVQEDSNIQQPSTSQPPAYRSPSQKTNPGYEEEKIDEESEIEGDEENKKEGTRTVTVPIIQKGGSLVVPVTLNNERDVQLILDTGATMTVLSSNVALELGLLSNTQTQVTTVNTAGGPIQVNLTQIDSIQIDTAKARNVSVVIHDLPEAHPGIDGLLGMSFLNNFLVTLDSDQGQLHLRPRHQ